MVQPKNFQFPFSKDSARVLLHEGVLFIPPQVKRDAIAFPGWGHCFAKEAPLHVEFCSGNGTWIIEKAKAFPSLNWVAVEKRFDRVRKIWSKRENEHIPNLLIVFGDARVFLKECIPTHSLHRLYINFPDPWPKRRHAKHKILSPSFFQESHRAIQPDGQLIFVTDDPDYSSCFAELAKQNSSTWKQRLEKESVPDGYGTSFFHSLFSSQGKKIHYHEIIY